MGCMSVYAAVNQCPTCKISECSDVTMSDMHRVYGSHHMQTLYNSHTYVGT